MTGLCAGCAYAKALATKGGGRIILCGLSKDDPAYPRYPRLPVLSCPGHRPS